MAIGFDLSGQTALVTGAGRGLGRSIAMALASAGANVALVARRAADLAEVARRVEEEGRRALVFPADASDAAAAEAAVSATVAEFGAIDVLVNNAGTSEGGPSLDVSRESWENVLRLNLTAPFSFSQAAGKRMAERKSGKIINVASMFGLAGEPNLAAYCASKGGLIQLTRVLAIEWARYNIQVNAVAPGYFETDMAAPGIGNPEIADRMLHKIPARRFGRPTEVGPLVVYLSSSASDYVTGEVITIDGGQSAR